MSENDLLQELEKLVSEGRNPNTMNIDQCDTQSILELINEEDKKVAERVSNALPQIAQVVEFAIESLKSGGRLIYLGAGTSGRLGVLDAVECRPTFSVPDNVVIGLIAGGETALINAVEGAEDNDKLASKDLKNLSLNANDTVVGIAASGRTPYVVGGLKYAKSLGCKTACVVCNPQAPLITLAHAAICVEVGPECVTGSTRMKSGTAQKLVLNMISTATMIKLGKVYENLMVDVNATNQKLHARATRIVMQATQCEADTAKHALQEANNSAKLAILMILLNVDAKTGMSMLEKHSDNLRLAMQTPTVE